MPGQFEIITTYGVLALVFIILATDRFSPALVAAAGAAALMATGILPTHAMLSVFGNSAPITIACMMIIASALSEAGVLDLIGYKIEELGKDNPLKAIIPLFGFVFILSGFMNNTPAVIVLAPLLIELGRKLDKSPYRYLIPLSYVAILGGMTTLIGTSTNILVDSIAQEHGQKPFHIFEITAPALLMAAGGLVLMTITNRFLLPDERQSLTRGRLAEMLNFSKPRKRDFHPVKSAFSIATLIMVVGMAALDVMPIAGLAFIGAVFVIVTGCITARKAYEDMDWSVLLLIFGMLGIGKAMHESGSAKLLIDQFVGIAAGLDPIIILAGLYLLTSFLTETVTNNAVAVILTPLVIGMCETLGLNVRPFLIVLMLASSAAFATPIGYQTNTYVYIKGGYKFKDFIKVGLPMNILMWLMAICIVPVFWDLQ